MKRRPRRVENKVAEHLTEFSQRYGHSPVERIPVLGRTGPDVTINELRLVVDVKSRVKVPKCALAGRRQIIQMDGLIGVRLGEIEELFQFDHEIIERPTSDPVQRWYAHMAEWLPENCRGGIPALVLHRPNTDTRNATLLIHTDDRRKFYDNANSA
jgi:hypothetical protein